MVWTIGIQACFCCYRLFLSTFSCAFYLRPESATFLLATVALLCARCRRLKCDAPTGIVIRPAESASGARATVTVPTVIACDVAIRYHVIIVGAGRL